MQNLQTWKIRESRLGRKFDKETASYASSVEFDKNIIEYDLLGSAAHAVMLCEQGIITRQEASKILKHLEKLLEGNKLKFDPKSEDVHMLVEEYLIKKLGEVGGKLHTARSRNDQIACDLRMWVREKINATALQICSLCNILLEISSRHTATILPGYTHLQHAQPTTLAHHLLAHCDALIRDLERLEDAYKRVNLNPLGSCALATTSFPIDRDRTSQLLGFEGLIENSIDAVAARDFMLETLSCVSILMLSLSRMIEELILWSTSEFGFVELSNEFSSTSSIMPQKKNPDVLEIMRARVSRATGNLNSSMSMVKSLPYAYNRDLQEISPLLLNSFEIAQSSLSILNKILKTLKINEQRMLSCTENFITATELADLLVREEKIPFRTAHQIVGRMVAENKIDSTMLERISKKVIGRSIELSDEKIKKTLSPLAAIESKKVTGGPSKGEARRMIASREKLVSQKVKNLKERMKKIRESRQLLCDAMDNIIGG
jgi:argininosuccinate lyase